MGYYIKKRTWKSLASVEYEKSYSIHSCVFSLFRIYQNGCVTFCFSYNNGYYYGWGRLQKVNVVSEWCHLEAEGIIWKERGRGKCELRSGGNGVIWIMDIMMAGEGYERWILFECDAIWRRGCHLKSRGGGKEGGERAEALREGLTSIMNTAIQVSSLFCFHYNWEIQINGYTIMKSNGWSGSQGVSFVYVIPLVSVSGSKVYHSEEVAGKEKEESWGSRGKFLTLIMNTAMAGVGHERLVLCMWYHYSFNFRKWWSVSFGISSRKREIRELELQWKVLSLIMDITMARVGHERWALGMWYH